jgi:hypothetical protein
MHTIRTRTIICYICAAPFLESLRCPNPARWQSTPPCAQSARNGVVDFRSKVADILGATRSSSSVYTRGTRFFINNRLSLTAGRGDTGRGSMEVPFFEAAFEPSEQGAHVGMGLERRDECIFTDAQSVRDVAKQRWSLHSLFCALGCELVSYPVFH